MRHMDFSGARETIALPRAPSRSILRRHHREGAISKWAGRSHVEQRQASEWRHETVWRRNAKPPSQPTASAKDQGALAATMSTNQHAVNLVSISLSPLSGALDHEVASDWRPEESEPRAALMCASAGYGTIQCSSWQNTGLAYHWLIEHT